MATVERTVRHLKLRARDESLVRSVVLRMEDALRTASLPDAGTRLLVVRKLSLGRIPEGISPQSLAILLEQKVASQGIRAVHGVSPGAEDANAVWFRDTLEACTALALRLASGGLAQEWFWPLAVCGWQPAWGRQESLRWLAFSLAAKQEAAVALPSWALNLFNAGKIGTLLQALHPGDGTALLQLCAVSADTQWSDAGKYNFGNDDRLVWANAMLKVFGINLGLISPFAHAFRSKPVIIPVSETAILNARAGRDDQSFDSPAARQSPIENLDNPLAEAVPCDILKPLRKTEAKSDGVDFVNQPALLIPSAPSISSFVPRSGGIHPQLSGHGASVTSQGAPSWELHGEPTLAGGLLFLLPVLEILGYRRWVKNSRGWDGYDTVRSVLSELLGRLAIAQDDPAWLLVASHKPGQLPRCFAAPLTWLELCEDQPAFCRVQRDGRQQLWDATERLLLAEWRGNPSHAVAALMARKQICDIPGNNPSRALPQLVGHAWLNACRRWLRRQAKLGLADLVMRPARISATPTHVDIEFDINLTDIRIRRAGLDINPGWLPWFGLVVGFHYERKGNA
ncbi:MAG: hypothetical protein ACOYMG_00255 [Candidatus Methylumidiphilus sp.]